MRNTKKWLVLLLTVVMLVSNLSVTAMATGTESPIGVYVSPAADDASKVEFNITAAEANAVADGRLVVTYDPAVLTYVDTRPGAAWTMAEDVTLSVNPTEGRIILAFASAEAAEAGILFTVTFDGAVTDTTITLGGDNSYTTGHKAVPSTGITVCPSAQFADMAGAIDLIHEAVDYMVGNGYMNGMDASHFGPNLELNRAMMVTILYRIAGTPAASGTHTFVDVPAGQFYTEPVIWAVENGITTGLDATHFAPGKSLTRQELVTFLYRFAKYMDYDVTKTTDLSAYTDANKVQPYALEAFQWAVAEGVVNGTSETTLSPENTTTRAQICIMVSRLLVKQN